jgi:hypothetical protein
MSAPDYTQRLTDRIFLLSPGCPQMCQASKCGFVTCRGPVWRYADQAQIKNASAKLVDPNCFSWSRPVRSVCPYRCSTSLIADLPA